MRRALEANDLLLHFQPEVSLVEMKTTVIEALLRWRQPDGRIATANDFMATTEQSGLILELGDTLQTGKLAVDALRELRRMGVAVALDDFGAGYSSLKSIGELPLTRVKLDRSLMNDVDSNPRAAAIAQSVTRLCHNLGLTVTAEGIERPAQLEFAANCGDVHLQGYLIARPAPLEHIARFIAESPPRLESIWRSATLRQTEPTVRNDASLVAFRRPRSR